MDERTEQPDDTLAGEASPPPPVLYWTMWVSVFAVIAWGLMLLWGRKPWLVSEPVHAPPEDTSGTE